MTTLTRMIAEVRRRDHDRLYTAIIGRVPRELGGRLEALLVVEMGTRVSMMERLRRAPTRASGRQLVLALRWVEELRTSGAHRPALDALPPPRVEALARYGLAPDLATLRRLSAARRTATLTATARALLTSAIDDTVDVFMIVMSERFIRPAERASDRQRLRSRDELADASTIEQAATVGNAGRCAGSRHPTPLPSGSKAAYSRTRNNC